MEVDPAALEQALLKGLAELGIVPAATDLAAMALDGKVLRGTRERHRRTRMMLSFLDQRTGLIL